MGRLSHFPYVCNKKSYCPARELFVTVHALRKQQRILPMLRIPNRQNLLPRLYHTAFSVQKMPTRVQ